MVGSPPAADRLVTLSNWQGPPWNRWSFQHVGQLIPSARISRGDGPVLELPDDPRDIDQLPFRTVAGTSSTLGSHLEASYTDGFLALHHGRIVAEQYSNGMTRGTRHLLQSVSKSLTGALAGALAGSGALDPAGLVTDQVPMLRGTSFEGATVRHLLDMTAGTRFSEDYDDPASDVRRYETAAGWQPAGDGGAGSDLAAYIAGLPNRSAHGEAFAYRSILTDVLAMVVEGSSAERFADAMSGLLWSRIGAEHDAEITVDRHGNAMSDGGISVTLRDLARFGQLYLLGGSLERPAGPAGGLGSRHALRRRGLPEHLPGIAGSGRRHGLAGATGVRAAGPLPQSVVGAGPRGGDHDGLGHLRAVRLRGRGAGRGAGQALVAAAPLDPTIAADTLRAFASLAAHLGDRLGSRRTAPAMTTSRRPCSCRCWPR